MNTLATLAVLAAAAAGYTAGRLRPGARAVDWAVRVEHRYGRRHPLWWVVQPIGAVAVASRPLSSYHTWRARRAATETTTTDPTPKGGTR